MPLRVVGGQVAVTVVAAALALIWSAEAAKAVFAGGAVAFLPNALFALAVERVADPEAAVALFGRWVVKLVLTVALLALALGVADLRFGAFFVGLGVALAMPLAAPLLGWADERAAGRGE